jgi:hypothetical protein
MRRKVALAVLAASTLVLGAVITHLRATGSRPRCGLEAYQAIRLGMTLEEAVAVVGVPPGDYTGGHVRDFRSETEYGQSEFIPPASRKSASHAVWSGGKGRISLGFDEDGRVWVKHFTPQRGGPRCAMFDWLGRAVDRLSYFFVLCPYAPS